ncbi:MAG: response regulator [Halanaerobium sp.]
MNRDKTILIVDDSKLNIQVLSDILKEKSYRIALARSGKVALEFVEMKRPDLILLDIMMPEIDGFETADKIYQRIKSNIKNYNQQHKLVKNLDISLGFSVKVNYEQNLDQIFKKADKMMYNNKRNSIYCE